MTDDEWLRLNSHTALLYIVRLESIFYGLALGLDTGRCGLCAGGVTGVATL